MGVKICSPHSRRQPKSAASSTMNQPQLPGSPKIRLYSTLSAIRKVYVGAGGGPTAMYKAAHESEARAARLGYLG